MSEALSLRASYGVDLQGKNMAKGTTIGVQIGWDFSAGPEEFTKTRRQQESNDALGKFNIESTEYDEDLFREERPKPLLRKKQKSVQQMLDEAEKYLDKK